MTPLTLNFRLLEAPILWYKANHIAKGIVRIRETRKNVYFTSKTLFVLEIIKFQLFRYQMHNHEKRNSFYSVVGFVA